jgi:DNA-binding PadR family transcriptional regulator
MARNRDDQRETVQPNIPFTGPSERYETDREPAREPQERYSLRDSEIQTLVDVGTFRTLTIGDLAKHRYAGNRALAQAEVRNLVREGFLRIRTSHPSKAVYAALTRQGKELLNRRRTQGDRQTYYAHFVKPRELRHDAAIYRLYQEVAARIAREGCHVRRVVLDFELKRSINPRLTKLNSLPEAERERQRQQIAKDHGLTVVDGRIPLPDLRIEYETAERDQTKVDVELATSDYHRQSLAAKARAGFSIYALHEDVGPLRRAINDPELTKDILSL